MITNPIINYFGLSTYINNHRIESSQLIWVSQQHICLLPLTVWSNVSVYTAVTSHFNHKVKTHSSAKTSFQHFRATPFHLSRTVFNRWIKCSYDILRSISRIRWLRMSSALELQGHGKDTSLHLLAIFLLRQPGATLLTLLQGQPAGSCLAVHQNPACANSAESAHGYVAEQTARDKHSYP